MRDTFVRTLIDLAKQDSNIELITGDLGFGVLKPYWETVPNQFTNAGIAEQHMTSMAAGMALTGKTVFTYSIGNFPTLRCLEQVRNDCAYHHANVKIVCVGGGFVYGSLGMSHHATEDLAIMRALPEVVVMAPGDAMEAEAATRAIAEHQGTCYLRLGRGGEKTIHKELPNFTIGKALPIGEEYDTAVDVTIFSTGAILDIACETVTLLRQQGVKVAQYSFPTVKPLDTDTIRKCALQSRLLVSIEEHNIIGGFGSAVAEVLADMGNTPRLLRCGISDEYCIRVGNQQFLRDVYGLNAPSIVEKVLARLD